MATLNESASGGNDSQATPLALTSILDDTRTDRAFAYAHLDSIRANAQLPGQMPYFAPDRRRFVDSDRSRFSHRVRTGRLESIAGPVSGGLSV